MPWQVPHVAPSNIQIRPQDEGKLLSELMRLSLMQQRLARGAAGGTGGAGGMGKGSMMFVPDPDNPGQFTWDFILGATPKERAYNAGIMQRQRAMAAISSDKELQEELARIKGLDNESARKALAKLKSDKLGEYATRFGIKPEELNKSLFGATESKLQQDLQDIKNSDQLDALLTAGANIWSRMRQMGRSIGASPEERQQIAKEEAAIRERNIQENAYLRDQALRQQSGASYFGENIAGSDVGSMLGGVAQAAESLGSMALPIVGGIAGGALGSLVAPGPGTLAGAAIGAGLGGYPVGQQEFTEELQARGLSDQQQVEALREGATQAGLTGAAVNAIIPPAMRGLGRGVQIARGAAASRMAPGALQRAIAPATEAELAARGRIANYLYGLPATTADVSAFTAANRALTNLNLNQAAGMDIPVSEGIGEEILGGAGMIPLFNLGRARARRALPVTPKPTDIVTGETTNPVGEWQVSPKANAYMRNFEGKKGAEFRPDPEQLFSTWTSFGPDYTVERLLAELQNRRVSADYIKQVDDYIRSQQAPQPAPEPQPQPAPVSTPAPTPTPTPAPTPTTVPSSLIDSLVNTAKGFKPGISAAETVNLENTVRSALMQSGLDRNGLQGLIRQLDTYQLDGKPIPAKMKQWLTESIEDAMLMGRSSVPVTDQAKLDLAREIIYNRNELTADQKATELAKLGMRRDALGNIAEYKDFDMRVDKAVAGDKLAKALRDKMLYNRKPTTSIPSKEFKFTDMFPNAPMDVQYAARDIKLRFVNQPNSSRYGWVDGDTMTINLGRDETMQTIMHELQHVLDERTDTEGRIGNQGTRFTRKQYEAAKALTDVFIAQGQKGVDTYSYAISGLERNARATEGDTRRYASESTPSWIWSQAIRENLGKNVPVVVQRNILDSAERYYRLANPYIKEFIALDIPQDRAKMLGTLIGAHAEAMAPLHDITPAEYIQRRLLGTAQTGGASRLEPAVFSENILKQHAARFGDNADFNFKNFDRDVIKVFSGSKNPEVDIINGIGSFFSKEIKASREVSPELERMWETMKKEFGFKEKGDNAKAQDKFNKSFSQYLQNDKVANPALKNMFTAMKNWLVNIYKALTGTGVRVSDEARKFFDRLLSTDRDIQRAEQANAGRNQSERGEGGARDTRVGEPEREGAERTTPSDIEQNRTVATDSTEAPDTAAVRDARQLAEDNSTAQGRRDGRSASQVLGENEALASDAQVARPDTRREANGGRLAEGEPGRAADTRTGGVEREGVGSESRSIDDSQSRAGEFSSLRALAEDIERYVVPGETTDVVSPRVEVAAAMTTIPDELFSKLTKDGMIESAADRAFTLLERELLGEKMSPADRAILDELHANGVEPLPEAMSIGLSEEVTQAHSMNMDVSERGLLEAQWTHERNLNKLLENGWRCRA